MVQMSSRPTTSQCVRVGSLTVSLDAKFGQAESTVADGSAAVAIYHH